jgi:hypothetical protein
MDRRAREISAYEIRCHHCGVSFPPETKRCIHCGERLGKPLFASGDVDEIPVIQPGDQLEEAEMEPTGGRWLRAGFTIFWLLLAFGSAAIRACQGE